MTALNELTQMPAGDYNADTTAVRKTWLDLIAKSPAHLAAHMVDPRPPTDPMKFGSAIHTMILEPDLVTQRYYVEPELGNRNRTDVKEKLAELAALNPGKEPVREDDWAQALAVRDSVYRSKAAKAVLGVDGEREASMFWTNAETGQLCKARYDMIAPRRSVPFSVDVKSTIDASPEAFAKAIWNYRYDVQAAHYLEPVDVRFVLLAVEKSPPYAVAVYGVSDAIRELGKRRRAPNLRRYVECKASGEWPGYPDVIQRIELPRWAR